VQALLRALNTPQGRKAYSVTAHFLERLFRSEQFKLEEYERARRESPPPPPPEPPLPQEPYRQPPALSVLMGKKSLFDRMRDDDSDAKREPPAKRESDEEFLKRMDERRVSMDEWDMMSESEKADAIERAGRRLAESRNRQDNPLP
jgi:hypothetical protein